MTRTRLIYDHLVLNGDIFDDLKKYKFSYRINIFELMILDAETHANKMFPREIFPRRWIGSKNDRMRVKNLNPSLNFALVGV